MNGSYQQRRKEQYIAKFKQHKSFKQQQRRKFNNMQQPRGKKKLIQEEPQVYKSPSMSTVTPANQFKLKKRFPEEKELYFNNLHVCLPLW